MAKTFRMLLIVMCCLACHLTIPQLRAQEAKSAQPTHSREFWHQIAATHYALPAGEEAFPMSRELSSYLASPDPELRDGLAYSILDAWIVRQKLLTHEQMQTLLRDWQGNLRAGIGESGTDSVFQRSFSALCLSILAERDLKDSFLTKAQFRLLLQAALTYLNEERDLRGFDAKKGWIHATAHTADLLAALASNPLFVEDDRSKEDHSKENQAKILSAIAQRLATAGEVFTYGEQDRLASVASVLAARSDFDNAAWTTWLTQLDSEDEAVWKETPPNPKALARFENDSYFLQATIAQISMRTPTPNSTEAQKPVLALLRKR